MVSATRTCVPRCLLSATQRDVDLMDLDLPLLGLPLPQQRSLQSKEVLLQHDAVVEEVQLVFFSSLRFIFLLLFCCSWNRILFFRTLSLLTFFFILDPFLYFPYFLPPD